MKNVGVNFWGIRMSSLRDVRLISEIVHYNQRKQHRTFYGILCINIIHWLHNYYIIIGVLQPLLKISMFCVLSQNYQHFFSKNNACILK